MLDKGRLSLPIWFVEWTRRFNLERKLRLASWYTALTKKNRAASSSLLNESCAFSETLADAEWVASWLGLAKDLNYDLRKRDKLNREIKITSILSEKDCELDIASITDAKSFYDTLSQEQYTGAEKRAALEVCVIRDTLEALGAKARWVISR